MASLLVLMALRRAERTIYPFCHLEDRGWRRAEVIPKPCAKLLIGSVGVPTVSRGVRAKALKAQPKEGANGFGLVAKELRQLDLGDASWPVKFELID